MKNYIGEEKNGSPHGQGTLTFPDGAMYIGKFKDGKRHGQGILTFADGAKYAGGFKDGSFNGQGTYTIYFNDFDGKRSSDFVGEWMDDVPAENSLEGAPLTPTPCGKAPVINSKRLYEEKTMGKKLSRKEAAYWLNEAWAPENEILPSHVRLAGDWLFYNNPEYPNDLNGIKSVTCMHSPKGGDIWAEPWSDIPYADSPFGEKDPAKIDATLEKLDASIAEMLEETS
jgi:hypothetical protein